MTEKSKKTRCSFCNKKTGLITFTCNCGVIFCQKHRYTHTHNCKYKEEKKEESKGKIKALNPKTESSTLVKID